MGARSTRHSTASSTSTTDGDFEEALASLRELYPFRFQEKGTPLFAEPPDGVIVCSHYKNSCDVICDEILCRKRYPCVRCHDENEIGHRLDRFGIKRIVCNICETEQDVSVMCQKCETVFGAYSCDICNIFDNEDLGYYHCYDCGICQVGGAENNFHCFSCNACIGVDQLATHGCLQTTENPADVCPICLDDLDDPNYKKVTIECGHPIHRECLVKMIKSPLRDLCPICRYPIEVR